MVYSNELNCNESSVEMTCQSKLDWIINGRLMYIVWLVHSEWLYDAALLRSRRLRLNILINKVRVTINEVKVIHLAYIYVKYKLCHAGFNYCIYYLNLPVLFLSKPTLSERVLWTGPRPAVNWKKVVTGKDICHKILGGLWLGLLSLSPCVAAGDSLVRGLHTLRGVSVRSPKVHWCVRILCVLCACELHWVLHVLHWVLHVLHWVLHVLHWVLHVLHWVLHVESEISTVNYTGSYMYYTGSYM